MDNTLGRYEPDNELFRNLVMMVLCFIFILFYTIVKISRAEHFEWYDRTLIAAMIAAGIYFLCKTRKYKKD